ncbi:hypothetical protein AD006_01190 [Pseudonocardia sp. EC080610-09]|uniref:hypothetical protein n=1 Tax=unclassified Pseudonocardia TaxID=2619320 RepID=UPI0006CB745B|nr:MULTISPECIES: hypothetical protein [unclassified Pseudonocardia]ALE74939.1 hypothetical protein FRP1_22000 [Pseudonocardia sp. EC080625-04]ALL74281.1 hypothetical protein AD006_01190 [Pseudonocardia sp. EC080610-09]ALL81304.1 hypothetical protein AD017_09015 [Pseudonocardia sp. EC080619-01]
MALTLSYDDSISRVRISLSTTSTVEHSTDGIRWTYVRGAASSVSAGSTIDDYEFTPGVPNFYRDSEGTASITPMMTNAWLKFVGKPYLNTRLELNGWDEISRSSRNGIFQVRGRVNPVVVTDVHSSRSTTVYVRTRTTEARDNLDLALLGGQVMLLHVPPSAPLPSMYVVPGDYSYDWPSQRSVTARWEIPVIEVAKPGPGVYGSAASWNTVSSKWSSWSAVSAANATYADLAGVVGSPSAVIVS